MGQRQFALDYAVSCFMRSRGHIAVPQEVPCRQSQIMCVHVCVHVCVRACVRAVIENGAISQLEKARKMARVFDNNTVFF